VARATIGVRRRWQAAVAAVALLAGMAPCVHAQPTAGGAASPASGRATAALGADLALQALAHLGVPYRYGGDDPARGFDCSGLVRHVARSVLGIDLPRNAEAMARAGLAVDRVALEVGDLVYFNTRGRRYSHVGVYIGEGRFVHAPTRNGQVRIESIEEGYWRSRFNGARRLHGGSEAAMQSPAPVEPARERVEDPGPEPSGGA